MNAATFKLAITLILYVLFCCFAIIIFEKPRHIATDPQQGDFFIDAQYYFFLAGEILRKNSGGTDGFWTTLTSHSPNRSTISIVALTTFLRLAFSFWWSTCIFLALSIASFTIFLRRLGILSSGGELFLISGVSVYLSVPSKEVFLLFGLLMLIFGLEIRSKLVCLVALLTITLSRPEAAIITVFSLFFANRIRRNDARRMLSRSQTFFSLSLVMAAYFFYRDFFYQTALVFEYSVSTTVQCYYGPFYVCVKDSKYFELVVLTRLFVASFIWLDWLQEIWHLFWGINSFSPAEVYIRGLNAINLLVLVWALVLKARRSDKNTCRWLIIFIMIYYFVYAGILFFQISRQIVFLSAILIVAINIKTKRVKVVRQYRVG